VNTKKTEVLSSVVTHDLPALSSVDGDTLSDVQEFTYLGNILSDSCSLDSEVENCIKAASSAFGRLTKRVFLNHNLVKWPFTEQSVSQLCCTGVKRTLYRRHVKAFEAFHIRKVCKASLASDGGRKHHTLSSWRKLE